MNHTVVQTKKAPAAIGPYSQAVIHNNIVYCAGQIPLDPASMDVVPGGVQKQTRQVMENLKQVLLEAGTSFGKVVKCSIFLDDMGDFKEVNEIYSEYFGENPPARETVAVETLPKHVKVEISCIAYI
ncbi:RidA family protein [Rhodohalobacter sp. SW132]|uniref:RidA family protein n=1 Tax=Rhodohalobacter sp. SW132 TaxID=2293433 RepID=UPI000E227F38|nr:RidA family protein [Rhodohalobacter sp. SW132]REL33273.1 RidA family protein [Rhodohalobacter sp. SW132]